MKGGGGARSYIKKYTKPIGQGSAQGGSSSTTSSCKDVSFITQLQKITIAGKALLPDDELSISNIKGELQTINLTGNFCGSIVSLKNTQIIECMQNGYLFKAVVDSISGSVCKVHVQIA